MSELIYRDGVLHGAAIRLPTIDEAEAGNDLMFRSRSTGLPVYKDADGKIHRFTTEKDPDPDPEPPPLKGHFVAPDGKETNDGTINSPWNIHWAFSHPDKIQPGDTVWIRGGSYHGHVKSALVGTAENRIRVRSYPGEQARIDLWNLFGGPGREFLAFDIKGNYTDYMDLEILNSNPHTRFTTNEDSTEGGKIIGRGQININGTNNRMINNVVHDLNLGIGFWRQATGGALYGNIVYNTGWDTPSRQWGNGIYTHNYDTATKWYRENIIFNTFGGGLMAYGGGSGPLSNMQFEGNVILQSGYAPGGTPHRNYLPQTDFLIGGSQKANNIALESNCTFSSHRDNSVYIGYPWGGPNGHLTMASNYLYSGRCEFAQPWDALRLTNNQCDRLGGAHEPDHGFRELLNPTGLRVDVSNNIHEPGRALVVVHNWSSQLAVPVNLGPRDDRYRIYHIYDLENHVFDGTGSTAVIPMKAMKPPTILGDISKLAEPIALPETFGVFLVKTIR